MAESVLLSGKEGSKNWTVAGKDFYLEITKVAEGKYRIFTGYDTFTVSGMDRANLDSLNKTGQLLDDFNGTITRVKADAKKGSNIYDVANFNSAVYVGFSEAIRKNDDLAYRLRDIVPSRREDGPKSVRIPTQVEDGINRDTSWRLPKNTKHCVYRSKEFEELYKVQLGEMRNAIREYSDGNKDPLLGFFLKLSYQMGGNPNGTPELVDMIAAFMAEAGTIPGWQFYGLSANYKGKEKILNSETDIADALKTDAGRTWLVGIFQNWEKGWNDWLRNKGYDASQAQWEILNRVSSEFSYAKGGEFERSVKAYSRSRLLEENNGFYNPVDYEDVARRSGGKGWVALGPSTLLSVMVIASAITEPPKKQVPPPAPEFKLPLITTDPILEHEERTRIIVSTASRFVGGPQGGSVVGQDYLYENKLAMAYTWSSYRSVDAVDGKRYWLILNPNPDTRKVDRDNLYVAFIDPATGEIVKMKEGTFEDKGGKVDFEAETDDSGKRIVLGKVVVSYDAGTETRATVQGVTSRKKTTTDPEKGGKPVGFVFPDELFSSPSYSDFRDVCTVTTARPETAFARAVYQGSALRPADRETTVQHFNLRAFVTQVPSQ